MNTSHWSGSSGEVKIGQVPLEVNTSQVLMRGEHQQGSLKVVSESKGSHHIRKAVKKSLQAPSYASPKL